MDNRINNVDELKQIYGVDYTTVKGYDTLDDEHKALFKEFIVNFWNAWGHDTRLSMKPAAVYICEDISHYVHYKDDEDILALIDCKLYMTDKEGNKTLIREIVDKDIEHFPVEETETTTYFRFEYIRGKHEDWMHIISADEWY